MCDPGQLEYYGVIWRPFDVELIQPRGVDRARHRFRAHLPELIWNTAALEGNNFTLPEVRTLLEGVTVGGKRLADEQQIIALSEAYRRLDEMVGYGSFSPAQLCSGQLLSPIGPAPAILLRPVPADPPSLRRGPIRATAGAP